ITDSTLVIMDCEGCEDDLLDPAKAPKLRGADVILEVHDFSDPSLKQRIHDRFSATHTITEYDYHPRNPDDDPDTAFLKTEAQRELAVIERPVASQAWFVMRANR